MVGRLELLELGDAIPSLDDLARLGRQLVAEEVDDFFTCKEQNKDQLGFDRWLRERLTLLNVVLEGAEGSELGLLVALEPKVAVDIEIPALEDCRRESNLVAIGLRLRTHAAWWHPARCAGRRVW